MAPSLHARDSEVEMAQRLPQSPLRRVEQRLGLWFWCVGFSAGVCCSEGIWENSG